MYEYEDRCASKALKGEVLERTGNGIASFTKGKLYVLQKDANQFKALIDDDGMPSGFNYKTKAKIVKTKRGTEAKVGDTVITKNTSGSDRGNSIQQGLIFVVDTTKSEYVCGKFDHDGREYIRKDNVRVLKPQVDPYKHLREAFTNGKTVEFQTSGKTWIKLGSNPGWDYPVDRYQIALSNRIAFVTEYLNGHPIGSRVQQIKSKLWVLADNSNSYQYIHKKYVWEDELLGTKWERLTNGEIITITNVSSSHICYDNISLHFDNFFTRFKQYKKTDIIASPQDVTQPQLKENTMSKIEITIDGESIDLCQENITTPKTDFESRKAYTVICYEPNGTERTRQDATKKDAKRVEAAYLADAKEGSYVVTKREIRCKKRKPAILIDE